MSCRIVRKQNPHRTGIRQDGQSNQAKEPETMSDSRFTDPRIDGAGADKIPNRSRFDDRDPHKVALGWIAGGVVLALLLIFMFGQSRTADQSAPKAPEMACVKSPSGAVVCGERVPSTSVR